jgi:cytochrome c5
VRGWVWLGIVAALLVSTTVRPSAQPATALPPGDGVTVVAQLCSGCHSIELVTKVRDGPEGWKQRVDLMVLRGAQLLPDEEPVVVAYLAKNFGPGMTPMRSGPGIPPSLADGPGKELVASHCLLCHDAGRLTTTRTRAAWNEIVKEMVARMPAGFTTPAQDQQISAYLAAHYGETLR